VIRKKRNWFCGKIMLKQGDEIIIQFNSNRIVI